MSLRRMLSSLFSWSEDHYWKDHERYLAGGVLRPYYLWKMRRVESKRNAFVPHTADIRRFLTPHGLSGIFISSGAVIGEGCVLFHQVTVGSNSLRGSKGVGAPVLGDHVYIGAGAKIIGGIRIGSHVRIGANCVVTEDVPDNCTVVMEKPRVIVRDTPPDNTFIAYTKGCEAELRADRQDADNG